MRRFVARVGIGLAMSAVGPAAHQSTARAQKPPETQAQPAGQATSEAIAAARELMTVSGAIKQFDTLMPTLIEQISHAFVQRQPAHERTIKEAFAEFARRTVSRKAELVDEIAGVYARHLSVADMKELTQFYSGPVGQRLIESQLKILPESVSIGQRWGQKIGSEIDAVMRSELRKKGVPL